MSRFTVERPKSKYHCAVIKDGVWKGFNFFFPVAMGANLAFEACAHLNTLGSEFEIQDYAREIEHLRALRTKETFIDKTRAMEAIRKNIKRELGNVTERNAPRVYAMIQSENGYKYVEDVMINSMVDDNMTASATIPHIEATL